MSEMILPRRKFLMGMAGLLAAPAIVRIESLMPVKSIDPRIKQFVDTGLRFDELNFTNYIRIRLPNDYQFLDRNILHKNG